MTKIRLGRLRCKLCGHSWVPRQIDIKSCPSCRRVGWHKGKKKPGEEKE